MNNYLEDVKPLLGLTDEAYQLVKNRIDKLISLTEAQLKQKLKTSSVPTELSYIVVSVVIKRYNRFGDEGAESISHSEKKISYQKTDFDEFAQEIQAYLDENDLGNRRTVEFL